MPVPDGDTWCANLQGKTFSGKTSSLIVKNDTSLYLGGNFAGQPKYDSVVVGQVSADQDNKNLFSVLNANATGGGLQKSHTIMMLFAP